jgi:HEAT repeat protein
MMPPWRSLVKPVVAVVGRRCADDRPSAAASVVHSRSSIPPPDFLVRPPSFRRAISARGAGNDLVIIPFAGCRAPTGAVRAHHTCASGREESMQFQSQRSRLAMVLVAAGAVTTPGAAPLKAQTRQAPVEGVIYDLKHPDPLRRQAAARDLGAAKYKAATPNLVAMANDADPAVRREVEFALERMEDIQALPGFIAFASDLEDDIRSRAVAALVNIHLPRSTGVGAVLSRVGELINVLPDRDLEVVVEPDVPIDPAVITTLQARLGDSERGIRRTAIRGLGILRAGAAVPDLLQVVREDRDDGLRFEGVRALRKINDSSVAPDLTALLNINSDTVRNELITTVGLMRYRGAVPELIRIVDQTRKTDTPRILALGALADIADPSSMELFDRLKADENEMLRLYAYEGIARTTDAAQKTAIAAARLAEKSARVRTAQAFALVRIGEIEYLDELIRGLEPRATRDLAHEYLLETPARDRPALFAPRPASATVRTELADVFGAIGDAGALPRLQEFMHDANGEVARAAARALRRIGMATGTR